jgi:hypothetical protein
VLVLSVCSSFASYVHHHRLSSTTCRALYVYSMQYMYKLYTTIRNEEESAICIHYIHIYVVAIFYIFLLKFFMVIL